MLSKFNAMMTELCAGGTRCGGWRRSTRSITLKRVSDVRSCRARPANSKRGVQTTRSDPARRTAGGATAADWRALSGDRGLRGRGWRWEGRDRQLVERVDGSALVDHSRVRRTVGRGERASGVLAVLEGPAAERTRRTVPELVVFPAPAGSCQPAEGRRRVR